MRLTPEEIARMIFELDAMVFTLLNMFDLNKIQIEEIIKPIREQIFALIVALGFENEYVSQILPPDAENREEIINKLYDAFRNYLAKLHGGEKK